MVASQEPSQSPCCDRRSFVAGAGSAALGGAGLFQTTQEEEEEETVVVPSVEDFRNNYAGQFLTILEQGETTTPENLSLEGCQRVQWPSDETAQVRGQLSDRRSDSPQAVQLPVFVDGRSDAINEDMMFIVNRATECDGGQYVQLDIATVTVRSVVIEEEGPRVVDGPLPRSTPTPEGDGPGFGLVAGAVGVVGALLARALRGRE